MASVPAVAVAPKAEDWPLSNPWTWTLLALVTTGLAAGLAQWLGDAAEGGRLALVLIGLLALGIALWVGFGSEAGTGRKLPRWAETYIAGVLAVGALLWGGFNGWRLMTEAGEFLQGYFNRDYLWGAPFLATWTAADFFCHLVITALSVILTATFAAAAFRPAGWTARDRGAALLGCAFLATWLAVWALYLGPEQVAAWDSMRLFLSAASLVVLLAAGLYALPVKWRRAGVSGLAVLHLAGICTAALGAPPEPWAVAQLWLRFYRPYLEFMYLNNAYRYYSPDPGPPSLLWFRVEYASKDGKEIYSRWVYLPDLDTEKGRSRHPLGLIYQRRLSLTQNTEPSLQSQPTIRDNDGVQRMNPAFQARSLYAPQEHLGPGVPLGHGGAPPSPNYPIIPFHPEIRADFQYQHPNAFSKQLFSTYARHVLSQPHPKYPDAVPTTVKIYRVIHQIMQPGDYSRGSHPTDMTLYVPYYEGEYDTAGKLTPAAQRDPFLYWLVPNMHDDRQHPNNVRCYYLRHAGDRDWVQWPDKTWHAE
jgi:hypothetical protein